MDSTPSAPRRWDPVVKLTHWGVVAAVIGNAILTEEGSGWHIWVGYGLAALLALRLLWGLIGPKEARFSAFPPSPARALNHIGEIGRGEVTQHRSHNPLGALMVYAIWATLLVVCGTGIAMSGPPPADPSTVGGEHGEGGEKDEKSEKGDKGDAEERGEARESEAHEALDQARLAPTVGAVPAPAASVQNTARARHAEAGENEEAEEREESGERRPAFLTATTERTEAGEGSREAAVNAHVVASGAADAMLASAERGGRTGARESGENEEVEEDEEGALGEVHEIAVNLLYILIALHLAGVVFETRRSGPQIVRAMVPGGTPRD